MSVTIFVLDIKTLMSEDVLKEHMAAAQPGRRKKALHMRRIADQARCIGAGILLAQAYAYYQKENRESAEADSLIVFADTAKSIASCEGNVAGSVATGRSIAQDKEIYFQLEAEGHTGETSIVSCRKIDCDLGTVFERSLFDRLPDVLAGHKEKPYFEDGPCFNLSHAGNLVACVMAPYPVGIDVEKTRSCKASVMKRCFSEEELARVHAAGSSIAADKMFTAIWTQKEALSKCTGNGLADIFDMRQWERPDLAFRTIRLCEEYVLTAAWDLPSEGYRRRLPGRCGQNSRPESGYPDRY